MSNLIFGQIIGYEDLVIQQVIGVYNKFLTGQYYLEFIDPENETEILKIK